MTTDGEPQDDLGWLLEAWDLGREPDWAALRRSGQVDEQRLEGLRRAHHKYENSKALVQRRTRDEPLLKIGHDIDGFHIVDRVGKGGMGEVYRARQQSLGGREVALKVMHPDHQSKTDVERFTRGAKALSELTHPHLVQVHGYGEADGLHYLVMRLVVGDSLADRIRVSTGGVDPPQAALWIEQIASALSVVHAANVVHRDVKPSNIVLDASAGDAAILVDFGVARPVDGATHTQPGHAPVTPAFAAPEQLDGRRVDARSDVYSLGLVLVDLLRGHDRRFRSSVGLDQLPGVDRALLAIVARATANDPTDRHAGAHELHTDLVAWREGRRVNPRTRRHLRAPRPRLLGAALLTLGLVATGAMTSDGGLIEGGVIDGRDVRQDVVAGGGNPNDIDGVLQSAAVELAAAGFVGNSALIEAFMGALDDPTRCDAALGLLARVVNERPVVDAAELASTGRLRQHIREIEDDASVRQPNRLAATSILSAIGDVADATRFAERLAGFVPVGEEPRLTFEALERVTRRSHQTGDERRLLDEVPWDPLLARILDLRERGVEMSWEQGAAIQRFVVTLHLARRRCGLSTDPLVAMPSHWLDVEALPWNDTLGTLPVCELAAAGDPRAKNVLGALDRRTIRDWQANLLGHVAAYLGDESFRNTSVQRLVELGWPRATATSSIWSGWDLGVETLHRARCGCDSFDDGGHLSPSDDVVNNVPIPLERISDRPLWSHWDFTRDDPPSVSGMATSAAGIGVERRSEGGDHPYLLLSAIGESTVELSLDVRPGARLPVIAQLSGQISARRYLPFQGRVFLETYFDGMPLESRYSSNATSSDTVVDLPSDWLTPGKHQLTIRLGAASTTSFRLLGVKLIY